MLQKAISKHALGHQTTYTKDGDVSFLVMVGCFDNLPPAMAGKTLKAGRYAVFTHRGTFTGLLKTCQYIFGTWLPATKEELDAPNNEVKFLYKMKKQPC